MSTNKVELYIYDLSKGMAAAFSRMLIGKYLEGVWHTSIVVFGREYMFNNGGIEHCEPGRTHLGPPLKVVTLGETEVPFSVFCDYITSLKETTFAGSTYNLLQHNCNNFTEELAQFLCGVSIPQYILDLPKEVLNSSLEQALIALVSRFERSARPLENQQDNNARESSPDLDQINSEIETLRYNYFLLEERRKATAKKERKREKKRRKLLREASLSSISNDLEESSTMADVEEINGTTENELPTQLNQAIALDEEERREEEERKKLREPPIVYKDILDVKNEFDALIGLIDGKLSPEEQRFCEELSLYMLGDEGSWALSDGFLNFIGRLLHDKDLPVEVRIHTINILAIAALKDDVILLLHQDRKDHVLMNYAFEIDRLSVEEQRALSLFVANMFENLSSSEWLLYISEWTYNNQQTSNIRVTTKVAVHCLLSELKDLQDRGAAIIHNMACKEVKTVVFDDVAVELTMALLQYLTTIPSEEQLYRCFKALAKFVNISNQEVPQLIQMIGPDPKTFQGSSGRVDELIAQVCQKLK